MDIYTLLREFADSWALLVLVVFFLAVVFWAFRPGSRKVHDEISQIPFRYEDKPAPLGDTSPKVKEA
jgi:cytochrome c oxidase cbb3-type subunit 4